jgi:hypothetical protein
MLAAGLSAVAQGPAPQDPATAFGFVYKLPDDWKIIEPKAPAPAQQRQEERKTSSAQEKRGILCLEVPLTARHGDPPTTIVVDALPYECYGQKLSPGNLETFGAGAAEGLKETLEITTSVSATYHLGGRAMWIQRAHATQKGNPGPMYTLETVCTLLSRAAVCWVARAGDEAGLLTFEGMPVTLDGNPSPALVPANVFVTSH